VGSKGKRRRKTYRRHSLYPKGRLRRKDMLHHKDKHLSLEEVEAEVEVVPLLHIHLLQVVKLDKL
jgi:hypothetical protein